MQGRIYQRGKTWAYVVDVTPSGDGKRRQQLRSGFATKREAQEALDALKVEVRKGDYREVTKELTGQYMTRWLDSMKSSLRPATWAQYDALTRTHIVPGVGGIKLQQLTTAQLNAFYGRLLESGRRCECKEHGDGTWKLCAHRDGKAGLSARTVSHVHGVIRTALNSAVDWGLLPRNPALKASVPKQRRTTMKTWSADEAKDFLYAVRDDGLHTVFALALVTGLRRGELLGLAWRDIDLEAGWLNVRQTLISVDHKAQLSVPKTDSGRRSIALDATAVELLRNHRLKQLKDRYDVGLPAQQPDDFVFATLEGKHLHPGLVVDAFDRRVKAAGIPRIRFHDLRHTAASLMLAAGVHPKVVQERLGHSSISITLDLYSHSVPTLQQDAAEKMGALLLSAPAAPVIIS